MADLPQPPQTPAETADAAAQYIYLYKSQDKIYPRSVKGRFVNWRWAFVWLTQLVFYLGPWLSWNDRQALLFDLGARRFYVFGLVLYPQDFVYLTALLMMSAYALFLFTAVAGRLWCGYACPQTVYTEIFMWVERKFEGDRAARMKRDGGAWTLEKAARKALFGRYRNPFTDDPSVAGMDRTVANTTPVWHAGRLFMTKEDGRGYEVNPHTLATAGKWDYQGKLKSQTFTAHPRVDDRTGELFFFGYEAGGLCDWIDYALSLAEQLQGMMDTFHQEIIGMGEDLFGDATAWLEDSLSSLSMGVDPEVLENAFGDIEQAIQEGPSALREATRGAVRTLTSQRYADQNAPADSPDGRFYEMTRTLPNVAAAELTTALEQEETAVIKAESASVNETSWKLGAVAQQAVQAAALLGGLDLAGVGRADRGDAAGILQARLHERQLAVVLHAVRLHEVQRQPELGELVRREQPLVGDVVDREHRVARQRAARPAGGRCGARPRRRPPRTRRRGPRR